MKPYSLAKAIEAADKAQNPRHTASQATVTMAVVPPSANGLFVEYRVWDPRQNRYKVRRSMTAEYTAWHNGAVEHIRKIQRPPMVMGEIEISLQFQRESKSSDLDNRIKPTLDALVAARVIQNDKFVIALFVRWADIQGVVAEVRKA